MTHFHEDSPHYRRAFAALERTRHIFGAVLVLGIGLTGTSQAANPPQYSLTDLGTQAVEASAPYSDNTSAAALRWRAA